MNREQMIQTVGLAISGGSTYSGSDRIAAHRVLDAILPQVTTVEELEALPIYSWILWPLLSGVWVLEWNGSQLQGRGERHDPDWMIDRYGPGTVVWRPES